MHSQETRIYFALLAGVIVLLLLMTFFLLTIVRYKRKTVADERSVIQQQFQLMDLEKERIAFDLHDHIGGLLSAIKMRLQTETATSDSMSQTFKFAETQIDVIMRQLRVISYQMMPSVLKRKGLRFAIEELGQQVLTPLGIDFDFSGVDVHPDEETALHLYRIVQEMFTNITKHSGADKVRASLKLREGKIVLKVQDNGRGFSTTHDLKRRKGMAGLNNIMRRISIIKAKLYLSTSPGAGVEYLIEK